MTSLHTSLLVGERLKMSNYSLYSYPSPARGGTVFAVQKPGRGHVKFTLKLVELKSDSFGWVEMQLITSLLELKKSGASQFLN
jgi:hypothetical protein